MTNMQRIVLASRPDGEVKLSDLRLESKPIPKPEVGLVLIRVVVGE